MEEFATKKQEILKQFKEKNFDIAKQLCEEYIQNNPSDSTILTLLGTLHYNLKNYADAIKYLETQQKKTEDIFYMLGNAYYQTNHCMNACKYFSKVVKEDSPIGLIDKLANCLFIEGIEPFKAIEYSLKIYKIQPFNINNILRLSRLYLETVNFEESIKFCNKIFLIDPNNAQGWIQKGRIEEVAYFDNDSARKCFKKAVKLGNKDEGYYNLALNYRHSDRNKSIYYARHLLKSTNPEYRDAGNSIIGTNYFAKKNIKTGFKYFKHRWDSKPERFKKSWDGKPHKKDTCLLHFTNGLGDQIMFIRYLPMLAKNFKSIKIPCNSNVLELFQFSYKNLENVDFFLKDGEFTEYDCATSIFSLPYMVKTNFIDIPYKNAYLSCDSNKIEEYRQKYFNTNKPKIGLCWESGNTTIRFLLNRTIPLTEFKNLLELDKIQLYSVQKNSQEINTSLFQNSNIIDLGSKFGSFYETASAIKNLDLLITVDTSVAHLAGALGVKTFMLLPTLSDWRWFDEKKECSWYNSIEIFKQTDSSTWEPEINRIIENILTMID